MPEPRLPVSGREQGPDPGFWGDQVRRDGVRRPPRLERPIDRLLERLARLRGDARAGVALLVLVAVVVGYVWYRAGAGSSAVAPASAASSRVRTAAPSTAATQPATGTEPVVVHVAGAVTTPGIVQVPAGARVADALQAAGGGLPGADLDRLNLAAKVVDGQRILVQKVGDPPAPADPSAASADPTTATGPINLNTATEAQLDELPGIGPTYAAAIVAERERRGGFKSVNELRDVHGIGEKRFADLKDLVTV